MNLTAATSPAPASFVRILGIVFICLAAFAIVFLLANIVVFNTAVTPQAMQAFFLGWQQMVMPEVVLFLQRNLMAILYALLAYAVFLLVAALAFLQRKNWARMVWIATLTLSILGKLGQLLMIFSAQLFGQDAGGGQSLLIIASGFALLTCLLFGWLILRLLSEPMQAEFTPQR